MGNSKSKDSHGKGDEGSSHRHHSKGKKGQNPEEIVAPKVDVCTDKAINRQQFMEYFKRDSAFVEKLFNFGASFFTDQSAGGSHETIDTQSLRIIVELLMLENSEFTLDEIRDLDMQPIELFVAIFTNNKSQNQKDSKIDQETCIEMMCEVFTLISGEKCSHTIRSSVKKMFSDRESVTSAEFMSIFRNNFEYGRSALREAMIALAKGEHNVLPKYDHEAARVLDDTILALFRMCSNSVKRDSSVHCLYNSAINGYMAPTFILIRHSYRRTDDSVHKGVIGAFCPSGWKDELGYYGGNSSAIFSIKPHIKFLYAYKGEGTNNFVYLNTRNIPNSKYKKGLGFGGQDFRDFRLWIDDEMMSQSYSKPSDKTYPMGTLNEGFEDLLNIEVVEAWGFGDESHLKQQEKHREMQDQMIYNSRKIDKKKLLDGEFGAQALSKNFGHRDQIDGDLDQMKKEAREGFDADKKH